MLIIAGSLTVAPEERDRYLALTRDVARIARAADGCLDFVQAADPIEPARINIFERWDSEAELLAFRGQGGNDVALPEVLAADVRRYLISSVEDP